MVAEFGIAGNTFFLGRSENIAQLLSVSDVCVLTSKAEGFSNSILEYMAAGRPVVATDVGGAREAIVEGETGFTVPAGNDRLMANQVVSLLGDPEKAKRFGEQGRRIVEEKFSTQALLENTETLYARLLAKRSAGARRGPQRGSPDGVLIPPSQPESCTNSNDPLSLESRSIAKQAFEPGNLKVRKVGLPPLSDLKLLIVAPSLDILGGQAVQADRLIKRLRELANFEVGFLPINPRLPGVFRRLQSIKYLRTLVTSLLYFTRLLREVPRYDVIHIFSASYFSFVLAQTPAILIAKLFRKKILLNYHSGEAEDHLTRWRTAVPTIRLVDDVAVPSKYLVKVFAKFGLHARAINNIVELDQFTFRQRRPLRPLFLSSRNLEIHYGVDQVLRAFALVQKQIPEAELIVAGDGSQRAALEKLALDLELRNTTFLGRVELDGIVDLYQRADIFLNGSEIDNQPLSILEAFACGLPVVTTDAGGIPDMVTADKSGCVVPRKNYEAMAEAALCLLREPDFAKRVIENAREACAKYSWEEVREDWAGLYQEMAGSRGTSANETKRTQRLTKLRRMSFAELRVRTSQAVNVFAERAGWSRLNKLPTDRALFRLLNNNSTSPEELLKDFQTSSTPFASFNERNAIVRELRRRWPEAEAQILAEADRIVAGRFDLLGFKDLSFGAPINWQREPLSGKQAPLVHWSRVDYLNPAMTGDKKVTWELNRHQYFLTLGKAYWLAADKKADEKYAATFIDHLNSWMDQNPPKLGINWASSLEISFRSISWLWALHFFRDSPALDSATLTRALKFLYLSGRHLETYLSTYFSPNTHLTGEALGLFYLGRLLPQFKDAARWTALGQKILLEQMPRQVKSDGVYFEQSSYYHRYTADFYAHFLILSRLTNALSEPPASAGGQMSEPPASAGGQMSEPPASAGGPAVEQTLQALLDHLMYITRPDGTSPLFGDDDGGRLLSLDRKPANDFRSTLSTAAALFARGDYKFVAGELAEETLWLLGTNGAHAFDQINAHEPSSESKDFPDGGYYVMRDGWHDKANYLLFDCGPHGTDNCGHAHADALAIEVAVNGKPVLIDPGTNTYTGSKEMRDSFRGSAAHNVLLVDQEPSSVPDGPFSWKTIARCKPASWISERRFDYVEGQHDGYERLAKPATHQRSILFLKNDYWVLRDSLTSTGDHELELRFHFASDAGLEVDGANHEIRASVDGRRIASGCFRPQRALAQGRGLGFIVLWRKKSGACMRLFGRFFAKRREFG